MTSLTIAELGSLTREYGGNWASAHVQRLLKLIDSIGTGLQYDPQVILWAVHLHDWGAFPKFVLPDCEHAFRSKQIAETDILPQADLPADVKQKILEAIALHDYRDQRPVQSAEALLLREADFLDFLGTIGIAREFAKGPKDLQKSYRRILGRTEEIRDRFTIPQARKIAGVRLARMEDFFEALLEESFGYL